MIEWVASTMTGIFNIVLSIKIFNIPVVVVLAVVTVMYYLFSYFFD